MLPLALIAMTTFSAAPESTFYVGTYTEPGGSKGIYRVKLNQQTGALSTPELAAEATAPSYLCIRPGGKYLYAVNEYSGGEVTAFAIGKEGLSKLNTAKFDGKDPCHVSVDPSGKWLFVSAYGGGSFAVLPILADGSVGAPASEFKNAGSGPNKKRQDSPHMHFASLVGKHVYACDLGTDEVLRFDFDNRTGRLQIGSPRSGKTNPGAGPRHFAASPDGKRLYVNNEMGMGVSIFERNPEDGRLKLIREIGTLGESEVGASWSTAAIKRHPFLPVVYVSNRGADAISVFDILKDGSLIPAEVSPTVVAEPRDFAIDPSGKWMVVAGPKSGELKSFRIDQKSGLLNGIPGVRKVSKPVCVVFAP